MRRPTIPLGDLALHVFGPDATWLAAEVGAWLTASPRFRAFVELHRDKIRKKARGLSEESQRDLAFELAVARRLLSERRFAVEYEPYARDARAPDFRVTFREHVRCNVEVRRVRASDVTGVPERRVARAVCEKLGQLRPGIVNVVVIGDEHGSSVGETLVPAMHWLDERAAARDDALFAERGFAGARDFERQLQRLSAVLWIASRERSGLWSAPRARHALPADLARALARTGA